VILPGEGSCTVTDNQAVMSRLRERAARRLRDGEAIESTHPFGENGVVVTNQRVFAFMPTGDGANFRAVERPNVEGAALDDVGNEDWLEYLAKGAIGGVVAVGVGLTIDFGSFIDVSQMNTESTGQLGIGSLVGLLYQLENLLGMLDQVFLVGGLLALAGGLAALGMYIESRVHVLAIEVAGGDDVHVPAPTDALDAEWDLQQVLRTTEVDDQTGEDDPLEPRPE
jgi:hypothetical protein